VNIVIDNEGETKMVWNDRCFNSGGHT